MNQFIDIEGKRKSRTIFCYCKLQLNTNRHEIDCFFFLLLGEARLTLTNTSARMWPIRSNKFYYGRRMLASIFIYTDTFVVLCISNSCMIIMYTWLYYSVSFRTSGKRIFELEFLKYTYRRTCVHVCWVIKVII